ncbi:MAG: GNAT family N-acetyltransferase [Sphingomicrobium sp.]
MTITYRDARAADAEAIRGLFEQGFRDTFAHLYAADDLAIFLSQCTLEAWQAELADPAFAFHLAEENAALIGFAKLGPHQLPVAARGPAIELRQLYVLQAWHGVGAAAALIDWTIAEARRRGAVELFLTVFTDNQRARHFYDRAGFDPVGEYKFMVGNHADDDIIMRLTL